MAWDNSDTARRLALRADCAARRFARADAQAVGAEAAALAGRMLDDAAEEGSAPDPSIHELLRIATWAATFQATAYRPISVDRCHDEECDICGGPAVGKTPGRTWSPVK